MVNVAMSFNSDGHMQLQSPPGINSAFDSQVAIQNVDSSLTSPLDVSGSNYPCHGHASQQILDSLKSVATMTANAPFDASQSFPRIYFKLHDLSPDPFQIVNRRSHLP
jgi:hypothetical protein